MSGLSAEVLGSIRALFFQECEELLADLETGLIALHKGEGDDETLNSVFRAVHSIKGSAGAFQLEALVDFAHEFESVLAAIRARKMQPDPSVVKLLLQAADVMADLVCFGRDGAAPPEGHGSEVAASLAALVAPMRTSEEALVWLDEEEVEDDPLDLGFTPRPVQLDLSEPVAETRDWTIRFRPESRFYAKGGEPLPLLRELERLGQASCSLDLHDLPPLSRLDPERAYVGWTIRLSTAEDEQTIRDVFTFVEGDCELTLVEGFEEAAPELEAAAPQAQPQRAADPQAASGPAPMGETIRVDVERLDRVVNLVGELLMLQSLFTQRLIELGYEGRPGAELPTEQIDNVTRELQDRVMALRAQPVRVVFQRMPRLVRELELATGKLVDLETVGDNVEVDRTVVERLVDPLTHMIRNAMDHGVEQPEVRVAAGKPSRGALRLSASHRNGRIVIQLSDDGAGIDRAKVRARAIERGLVHPDATLTDAEIDSLIFAPGFSTAAVVSDLSGRGVGMDVVKRSIESLGGRISFTSTPGVGSTFSLTLPLTLAVLDGMAVQVCGQRFVVPLTALVEAVQPGPGDIRTLGPEATLLALRGDHLPLIDLGRRFGYRLATPAAERPVALVVEDDRGGRAALLVDRIDGHRQVVIRSLEQNYRHVDGVSAAAVSGDGQVVLIVDVHAVLAGGRRELVMEPEL